MKKDNNKKQDLQTRREFFKKAAKTVLPIIGSILIIQLFCTKSNK